MLYEVVPLRYYFSENLNPSSCFADLNHDVIYFFIQIYNVSNFFPNLLSNKFFTAGSLNFIEQSMSFSLTIKKIHEKKKDILLNFMT